MASSILRLFSQKVAAKSSLRLISRAPNFCGSSKLFRSFKSSSTLQSRMSSPWLMLPPAFEGGNMVYNFYSLADNKIININSGVGRGGGGGGEELELPDDINDLHFVGSSHGWLALFNQRKHELFLTNPLSRRHIKLPDPPIILEEVNKIIISSSPDEDEDECRAIISTGPYCELAYCCPGRSTDWTHVGTTLHDDFVYSSSQKLLFCTKDYNTIQAYDLKDLCCPRMTAVDMSEDESSEEEEEEEEEEERRVPKIKFDHVHNYSYRSLVVAKHSNELYDVIRFLIVPFFYRDNTVPYKTIGFVVGKYDSKKGVLRYMDGSLDGLAFFVGNNHSLALSPNEFPELKPNAIYFTDVIEITPIKEWYDRPYGGHDLGIYDYENRTFSSCYYARDVQSVKKIMPAPMWFTPSPL